MRLRARQPGDLARRARCEIFATSGMACEQRRFVDSVPTGGGRDDRREWLERRALKVLQNDDTPLYLFTLAAEEVDLVADVARIGRDEAGKLIGYQRPEKQKHVKQIQEYLDWRTSCSRTD